jgi:hypothetical protein
MAGALQGHPSHKSNGSSNAPNPGGGLVPDLPVPLPTPSNVLQQLLGNGLPGSGLPGGVG